MTRCSTNGRTAMGGGDTVNQLKGITGWEQSNGDQKKVRKKHIRQKRDHQKGRIDWATVRHL